MMQTGYLLSEVVYINNEFISSRIIGVYTTLEQANKNIEARIKPNVKSISRSVKGGSLDYVYHDERGNEYYICRDIDFIDIDKDI